MRRLAWLGAVIGIGLAAGAPFALAGNAFFDMLGQVGAPLYAMLVASCVISGVAKAGKLQILLACLGHRLPFSRTTAITFATDFAFLSSPAGAAGYVVNVALLRSSGASLSVSTTVVGAEQALDFVFFAAAIPLAAMFALVPLAALVPTVPGSVGIALLVAVLSAALASWHARHFMSARLRDLLYAMPWVRARRERIAQFVAQLREQVHTIVTGTNQQSAALLLLTTLQWLTRYGVLWLLLREFGHPLPFGFVLVLQIVVLHLAQLTGIPAGGGGAELGLAAALGAWATTSTIASVLLLWRFSTLYVPLLMGALSFALLSCTRRSHDTLAYETSN